MTKRKSAQVEKVEVLSSDNPKDRARMAVYPEIGAAMVMDRFNAWDGLDVSAAAQELVNRGNNVVKGNTAAMERMLVSQAHALQAIFVKLARCASTRQSLTQFEANMRIALRAQNQCRMTLETLATIKNPPVVFAKQANIANNQQVNNGEAVPVARAGETGKPQTELSRLNHGGQSLDFGTPAHAGRRNPAMATLEAIDRAAHESGQGEGKP